MLTKNEEKLKNLRLLLEASEKSKFDDEDFRIEIWSDSRAYYVDESDSDNVYSYNKNKIEGWFYCGHCGKAGFKSEMPNFDSLTNLCKECKHVYAD